MTALFPLRPPPRSVARAGFLSSLSLSVPICRMRITALRMGPVWIVRCCWTVVLIWGGPAPGDTGLGLWTSVVVTTRGAPGIEWVGGQGGCPTPQCPGRLPPPGDRPAPNAHRAEGRPWCLVSCLARTGASRHVSRLSVCLWTTASLLFPRTHLRDRCTPPPGPGRQLHTPRPSVERRLGATAPREDAPRCPELPGAPGASSGSGPAAGPLGPLAFLPLLVPSVRAEFLPVSTCCH